MKKILESLRSNPTRIYGFLFALIILSAILAFFLAQGGSTLGLALIMALLVCANFLIVLIR